MVGVAQLSALVLTHLDTRSTGNRGHPADPDRRKPLAASLFFLVSSETFHCLHDSQNAAAAEPFRELPTDQRLSLDPSLRDLIGTLPVPTPVLRPARMISIHKTGPHERPNQVVAAGKSLSILPSMCHLGLVVRPIRRRTCRRRLQQIRPRLDLIMESENLPSWEMGLENGTRPFSHATVTTSRSPASRHPAASDPGPSGHPVTHTTPGS